MSVGNDGFTDCNYVCNPENFMQWSCNKYCPGFEFIAPAASTSGTTTKQYNVSAETNKNEIVLEELIVYLCTGFVVAVAVFVLIICCKKRFRNFLKSCREKKLKNPTQVQTLSDNEDESGNTTRINEVLPLVAPGTEQNSHLATVPSENSSDSGVVVPSASFHIQNESEESTMSNEDFDGESNRSQHIPREDVRGSSEVTYSFAEDVDTVPKRLSKQTCIITEQNMTSNANDLSLGTPSDILRVLEDN